VKKKKMLIPPPVFRQISLLHILLDLFFPFSPSGEPQLPPAKAQIISREQRSSRQRAITCTALCKVPFQG